MKPTLTLLFQICYIVKNNDNTFSFEKAEDSSGFLLWQVTNLWQREIKKALEKYGLTHSQYVLMASIHWLTLNNQDVTQILLSSHTKIDPMTTSTVLRTLQTKGLLKRQEHATDTRAKTVVLTDNGKKIIKQAVKTVEAFDRDFFSTLGPKTTIFNNQLLSLLQQEGKKVSKLK
jgi:DNA-binding MarR family transcriptional regulator